MFLLRLPLPGAVQVQRIPPLVMRCYVPPAGASWLKMEIPSHMARLDIATSHFLPLAAANHTAFGLGFTKVLA